MTGLIERVTTYFFGKKYTIHETHTGPKGERLEPGQRRFQVGVPLPGVEYGPVIGTVRARPNNKVMFQKLLKWDRKVNGTTEGHTYVVPHFFEGKDHFTVRGTNVKALNTLFGLGP
jgi:hypothetical protein